MVFQNKNKLLDHIDTHQDTRLACRAPRCDKSFVTAHALAVHIKQSHPRCNYPLCQGGVSDHHHTDGLRYSCSHTMSPADAKICEGAPSQPGTTFFCPDHLCPLILTEYGRPLTPKECLDMQDWIKSSRMWKKIPFCNKERCPLKGRCCSPQPTFNMCRSAQNLSKSMRITSHLPDQDQHKMSLQFQPGHMKRLLTKVAC